MTDDQARRLEYGDATGIIVRAKGSDGEWYDVDVGLLTRDSLVELLEDKGTPSWVANVIQHLLGHDLGHDLGAPDMEEAMAIRVSKFRRVDPSKRPVATQMLFGDEDVPPWTEGLVDALLWGTNQVKGDDDDDGGREGHEGAGGGRRESDREVGGGEPPA